MRRSFGLVAASVVLLGSISVARAQEPAQWYREQVDEAVRAQRLDRAVSLLQEAQRTYDERAEFFLRLGDLYYGEELYALALEEYLEAERRDPDSYRVLESIAFTLGLLNRETRSADYWFRISERFPDRIAPAQNLGWLLFKLHRLDEGVDFLRDAWERFGPDADIAMTLGTLHAERYDFANASEWYRRSIDLATMRDSPSFTAVAYYNLSLIQKLFHRYEQALVSTERSIEILPRPTGYLARGELYELRMDFSAAHADYLRAYELDEQTPLGRLNLALLYYRFGRLDDALAFARSVFDEPDNAWLYYYGTDATRHEMELHDLLADIHAGLASRDRQRVATGAIDFLRRIWGVVRHRVLGWYHRARFRSLASVVAERVLDGGNTIDGAWYLFRANEHHPLVASRYLAEARSREVALIPQAEPFYASEALRLRGQSNDLLDLAARLESPWQRRLLEETLLGALESAPGRSYADARYIAAASELYRINPGAFVGSEIDLPVALEVRSLGGTPTAARRVARLISRVGIRPLDGEAAQSAPRLVITVTGTRLSAELSLPGRAREADAELAGAGRADVARAVNQLAGELFSVP